MMSQWLFAFLLAALVAAAAWRLKSLNTSGAIAAIALGTIVVGTGGWWPGIILVTFFVTSSIISKLNSSSTIDQAKGSRRDWLQVMANGWGVLAGGILYAITDWQAWLAFGIGSIAAATADTWSSEIGRLSNSPPRLVTTWKPVPRGTSGAVSSLGTLAAMVGALLIALIAIAGMQVGNFLNQFSTLPFAAGIVLGGFLGGLLDSFLGATVQEQRWCDVCNVRTESNPHRCGTDTRVIGGIRGFNNDVVNFLCVSCGALIGLISSIL